MQALSQFSHGILQAFCDWALNVAGSGHACTSYILICCYRVARRSHLDKLQTMFHNVWLIPEVMDNMKQPPMGSLTSTETPMSLSSLKTHSFSPSPLSWYRTHASDTSGGASLTAACLAASAQGSGNAKCVASGFCLPCGSDCMRIARPQLP